jgi:hypothetical protein
MIARIFSTVPAERPPSRLDASHWATARLSMSVRRVLPQRVTMWFRM